MWPSQGASLSPCPPTNFPSLLASLAQGGGLLSLQCFFSLPSSPLECVLQVAATRMIVSLQCGFSANQSNQTELCLSFSDHQV